MPPATSASPPVLVVKSRLLASLQGLLDLCLMEKTSQRSQLRLVQVTYPLSTLTIVGRNQIPDPSTPSAQTPAEASARMFPQQISDDESTMLASLLKRIAELEGKTAVQMASSPIRGTPGSFVRTSAFNLGGSTGSSLQRSPSGIVPIYISDPANSQDSSALQHTPLASNSDISNHIPAAHPSTSEEDSDDDTPKCKRVKGARDFQELFQLGSREWLDFRVNSLHSAADACREQ